MSVLLVDDHDLFRRGLRALLEDSGFAVDEATGDEDALSKVRERAPDVVLIDVDLGGISGVETTRRLREIAPSTPVVVLTATAQDADVVSAVVAGASGYLLKDAELDDIVTAVTATADGHCTISPRVAGGLLTRVRADARRSGPAPADRPELSARECQILELLVEGCDNQEIARRLFISPSTVKNQISTILEKLGVQNRVQAAVYAVRTGLVDPDAPRA